MDNLANWMLTEVLSGATLLQAIVLLGILVVVLYNLVRVYNAFFNCIGEKDE